MVEERHRKNLYNFQQLSYDHHEWDYNSWTWTGQFKQRSSHPDTDTPVPLLLYNVHEYNAVDFGDTAKHGTKAHDLRGIDLYEHVLKLFSADIPKEYLYRQNAKLRAEKHCRYKYNEACEKCSLKDICDGFHSDYAEIFGTSEAKAVELDAMIEDSTHYIKEQEKVID
jgi:hypothetical protein